MSDLLRLQDSLLEAQRWTEAKTVTAAVNSITELRAKVEELESAFDKAMEMLYEAYAGTVQMKEVDAIRASLTQEGRLERSLSRSTAFPASQAAPTQKGE